MHSEIRMGCDPRRLARVALLTLALLPAWRVPAAAARTSAAAMTAPTVTGPAAFTGSPGKSVHEFASCFLLVLGLGGVLLAFASGLFAPVLGLVLVGAAWEVCS